MAIPLELIARKGDLILPKWNAFLDFLDRTVRVVRGEGVRMRHLPSGGLYIYADDNFNPWACPFKVSAGTDGARVREGTLNGLVPRIAGVPINGVDDEGNRVEVPLVELTPKAGGKSYVALRLVFKEEPVEVDPADPEALTIVEVAELPELFTQGGSVVSDDNSTLYPLAVIYWNDDGDIERVFQITHHNLTHRFVNGSAQAGTPSRHLFWAS